MKNLFFNAVVAFVGLTVGNFFFQLTASTPRWDVAVEISFYQCIAVAAFAGLTAWETRRRRSS